MRGSLDPFRKDEPIESCPVCGCGSLHHYYVRVIVMKNRIMKFRGKTYTRYFSDGSSSIAFNGYWIYGNFIRTRDASYIIPDEISDYDLTSERIRRYDVISNSVSQFTGKFDINGIEIYEGDIVLYTSWDVKYPCIVEYDNEIGGFTLYSIYEEYSGRLHEFSTPDLEVIGNIYDDSKRLREGAFNIVVL